MPRVTDTATPPSRSHRRRWIIAAVVTVAVAVVVGVAAWIAVAADARSNIIVVPQSLTCGSTKTDFRIFTEEDSGGPEVPTPAFEASAGPGTSCNLTVVVANTGSRPVHLRTAEFPGMSPAGGGSRLVVTREMSLTTAPRDHDGDNTAVFDIDETLGGDETSMWQFQLEHNPEAPTCWDRQHTQWHSALPIVTTSALGLDGTTTGSVNLVTHGKGKAPKNCG